MTESDSVLSDKKLQEALQYIDTQIMSTSSGWVAKASFIPEFASGTDFTLSPDEELYIKYIMAAEKFKSSASDMVRKSSELLSRTQKISENAGKKHESCYLIQMYGQWSDLYASEIEQNNIYVQIYNKVCKKAYTAQQLPACKWAAQNTEGFHEQISIRYHKMGVILLSCYAVENEDIRTASIGFSAAQERIREADKSVFDDDDSIIVDDMAQEIVAQYASEIDLEMRIDSTKQ